MNKEEITMIITETLKDKNVQAKRIEYINQECFRIITVKKLPEEERKQLSEELERRTDLANIFVVYFEG